MKATPTTSGVRIQASSAKENPIVAVMVKLLKAVPTITTEEAARHSVQCDADGIAGAGGGKNVVKGNTTWRNWVEVPSRFYCGR